MRSSAVLILTLLSAVHCSSAAPLDVRVELSRSADVWTYTVHHDGAAIPGEHVSSFLLSLSVPFAVVGTPLGWSHSTDGASYVSWSSSDNLEHIAPGAALGGFSIWSSATNEALSAWVVQRWNHNSNQPGLAVIGSVLTPELEPVPEPATVLLVTSSAAAMLLSFIFARRRQSRNS